MAGTEDDADFAGMSLDADRNLLWTYQVRQVVYVVNKSVPK